MRAENDNPEEGETLDFRASRLAVFLPTMVIAMGSAVLLTLLVLSGRSDTAPAWLCLAILVLGVPMLTAHALLRLLTIRMRLLKHAVQIHRGFPRSRSAEIPYALIRGIRIGQRPAIRSHESGTLVLTLVEGTEIPVPDLFQADEAKRAIRRMAEEDLQAAPMAVRRGWHREQETATVG
jgi:membrane protein YdbS with pleckstrin-like domain